MTLRRCKGRKLPGILTFLVIASISLAVVALSPTVSADTDGIVTTNASLNPAEIDINILCANAPSGADPNSYLTTRVTLTADSVFVTEKVPVDVMHVIDRSGSMDWYGDVIHNSSGTLVSSGYTRIDEFYINSSNTFDVLLVRQTPDECYEYLQIRSPSGNWYGADKYNPPGITYVHSQSAERIVVGSSKVETGTWEAWARVSYGAPRDYKFAVQVMPKRLDSAQDAATTFVGLMSDQDQIGVVSFSTYATLNKQLTLLDTQLKRDSVNYSIDSLEASGSTAIGEGIKTAKGELTNEARGRSEAVKVMVLLSDGVNTAGSDPIAEAEKAAAKNIKIFTVGLGEADHELLQDIADITGGKYYYAPSGSDLEGIYKAISGDIIGLSSRNYAFYVLPDNVEYADNATKEPDIIIGNTLLWGINDLEPSTPWDVSFDLRPIAGMGEEIPLNVVKYSGLSYELLGTTTETLKVTAGGNSKIENADTDVSFGFVIQRKVGEAWPEGELEFHDHTTGMNLHSESMEILATAESLTVFRGTAEVNGTSGYEFIVQAEENAAGDIFEITITGPGNFSYRVRGTLTGGEIKVDPGSSGYVPFPPLSVTMTGASLKVLEIYPAGGLYIGDSVPVTGYAEVKNTGSKANVSVTICVDGNLIAQKKSAVLTDGEEDIPISTTWIPMSSGVHALSVQVHGLKDDGTEFWTDAQGPNTNTTRKTIYIKKVKE
ncbi:MAG TPA: VWA domain-containing protein [Candidatus Bathyarchaeia archaeon]|nr:VWA domain-containing protein [Candidatus Bathyarchaeia archaeon]